VQWSQLKVRIESLFADSVRGRVELRTTRYRKAYDGMGRGWITLDKKQIINMCDYAFESKKWQEAQALRRASGCVDYLNPEQQRGYYAAWDEAPKMLHAQAVFARWDMTSALFEYLSTPMEEILTSPNPIIRGIGMLDRRVGKSRIATLAMGGEHVLVRRLHAFRCQAEGWHEAGDAHGRG